MKCLLHFLFRFVLLFFCISAAPAAVILTNLCTHSLAQYALYLFCNSFEKFIYTFSLSIEKKATKATLPPTNSTSNINPVNFDALAPSHHATMTDHRQRIKYDSHVCFSNGII